MARQWWNCCSVAVYVFVVFFVVSADGLRASPLNLVEESTEGTPISVSTYIYDSTGEGGLARSHVSTNIGNQWIPQLVEVFNPVDPSFYLSEAGDLFLGTVERYPSIPFYFILHHPGFGSLSGHTIPGAHYEIPDAFGGTDDVFPKIMVPVSFSDFGLRPYEYGTDAGTSMITTEVFFGDTATTAGLIAPIQFHPYQRETTITLKMEYLPGHTLFGDPEDVTVRHISWNLSGGYSNGTLVWSAEDFPNFTYPAIRPFPVTGPIRVTLTFPGYQPATVRANQQTSVGIRMTFLLVPDPSSPSPGISPGDMPNPGLALHQFGQKDLILGVAMPAPRLLPGVGDANRDGVIDAADMWPR